jgi:hypothetical protein
MQSFGKDRGNDLTVEEKIGIEAPEEPSITLQRDAATR